MTTGWLYPSRSTVAGSSRAARRAGIHAARTPTATSTAAAPANVTGSRGSRWNSSASTKRAAQRLPARPKREAGRDQHADALEHEAQDAGRGRAQRHAQPNLRLPRAHGVRDDAVEADGRQQQREPAEEGGEHRDEPLLRDRRLDQLIEGPERECDRRIGLPQRLGDVALHRRALAGRRVDGQQDGRPERRWLALRQGTYIVASMPSRGVV